MLENLDFFEGFVVDHLWSLESVETSMGQARQLATSIFRVPRFNFGNIYFIAQASDISCTIPMAQNVISFQAAAFINQRVYFLLPCLKTAYLGWRQWQRPFWHWLEQPPMQNLNNDQLAKGVRNNKDRHNKINLVCSKPLLGLRKQKSGMNGIRGRTNGKLGKKNINPNHQRLASTTGIHNLQRT